ncbi:MAG: hypothetical protein JST40_13995 [Armatimonadetes bacterium]|nr:hypothetical protein [Armatimonadota bacterium]
MKKSRSSIVAAVIGLFVVQAGLGLALQPIWAKNYMPKQKGVAAGLNPDQLLAALAGFREMVAGILWVRADSFFENGNYDAILPIIRIVTLLDPHQLDVYATGMWHIGYNFTDLQQRSDRRYLPSAIALGSEGAKNNPDTYEMFFETGWIWHHKIEDGYDRAVKWWDEANTKKDILPARRNLLASAYIRNGQIEKAMDYYAGLLAEANKRVADKTDTDPMSSSMRDTIERNLDNHMIRMSQRGWMAKTKGHGPIPYDTEPPFDVGFSVKVTVTDAKKLEFEGTWNVLPVGTRIRVILRDADYPHAIAGGVDWDGDAESVNLDPPTNTTYMQDQLYVRNRRFTKKIDMSADPTMYPFNKDKYLLEFYYSPRNAPPHIQDKFSWDGQGLTDKNFLNTEIRPGVRVIYTSFEISRDEILRRGEWADKAPVRMTSNFKKQGLNAIGSDVINSESLRSSTSAPKPAPTGPPPGMVPPSRPSGPVAPGSN